MIVVVNKSKLVSNEDVLTMARACYQQLRYDAAPIWGRPVIPVVYSSTEKDAPPGAWVIGIMDDAHDAGTLGWHNEKYGEVIYGRVFAKPVLRHGGNALTGGSNSVSAVLSHEVLETFIDPNVNLWADRGDGTAVALEIADPVESDSYPVEVDGRPVSVSNFVTPAWFDPNAKPGSRFDWLRSTNEPFQMSRGGYLIEEREGKNVTRWGDRHADWRKEMKESKLSRTYRRGGPSIIAALRRKETART